MELLPMPVEDRNLGVLNPARERGDFKPLNSIAWRRGEIVFVFAPFSTFLLWPGVPAQAG